MSTALAFQNTSFDVIDQNGKPWLQARQIGAALGYSRPDAVLTLYERNKDEFSPTMTRTIELMVGGQQSPVRIFSLRGCHLLAMFARTSVAKAFRAWVLDVLERLGESESRPQTRLATKVERKPLVDLVKLWVSMAPIGYGPAFRQVNAAFGVSSVEEMTTDMVLRATGWVQARIDAIQRGQGLESVTSNVISLKPRETSPATVEASLSASMDRLMEMKTRHWHEFKSLLDAEHRNVGRVVTGAIGDMGRAASGFYNVDMLVSAFTSPACSASDKFREAYDDAYRYLSASRALAVIQRA